LFKVISIIGTRPEAIKMAVLHRQMLADDKFNPKLCSTGQHKALLSQALDQFDLKPDVTLNAIAHNGSLAEQTAYITQELQILVDAVSPDLIIVQGDTQSAYCGAMVAFFNKIPLAHVEAGPRTGNKMGPFPEEINRKYIDSVSDFLFAPTKHAKQNLLKEGYNSQNIFITGNTGIDALKFIQNKIKTQTPTVQDDLQNLIKATKTHGRQLVLLTMHRREISDDQILQTIKQLEAEAESNKLTIIYPLHPHPRFDSIKSTFQNSEYIKCISALSYSAFVWLMEQVDLIFTDSGGIQEEASTLGKALIVLRNETERPEIIKGDNAILSNSRSLSKDIKKALQLNYKASDLFGDGKASLRIIDQLKALLSS